MVMTVFGWFVVFDGLWVVFGDFCCLGLGFCGLIVLAGWGFCSSVGLV